MTISGSLESTLWNLEEAAAAAGVSKKSVSWWVSRGYLARVNSKTARTPLFRAQDVLRAEYEVRCRRELNSRCAA